MDPVSLYIHIPFCQHRCGYCDFTTYAGMQAYLPTYVVALTREIELIGRAAVQPIPVHTIFFGGGTPSLLNPEQVANNLYTIQACFEVLPDPEITMEANPGTVTGRTLTGYRQAGVNRISFGMQSAIPAELRLLQRIHSPEEVTEAVRLARGAGFDNINLDLIFGIPGQTMESWRTSLDVALSMEVEHLSLYNLTIEEGTPLLRQVLNGEVIPAKEDLVADMYEQAIEILSRKGFLHYEISNWASRRGEKWMACQHNLQYWRNLPYLGFGVGAHGFFDGVRMENTQSIPEYIQTMNHGVNERFISPAHIRTRLIPVSEQMGDTMMLGLRLLDEGVSPQRFFDRFGTPLEFVFGKELKTLINQGLVEKASSIRLTSRGMMVGNQVFMRFVGD